MHGAASPFTWQGLSPYDVYQQAAQGLQAPAVLPPLQPQPHIPHMPSVMNPRLPSPWINQDLRGPSSMDAYLHKLQGINGYPSSLMFGTSQSAINPTVSNSLPAFHSIVERNKKSNDLSGENNFYKNDHMDRLYSRRDEPKQTLSTAQVGLSQTVPRDVSPFPFLPSLSTHEHTAPIVTESSNTISHLKWKDAHFTSSSASGTTPQSASTLSTTSVEFMPVSANAASVIPYYSKPRDFDDTYSIPNGLFHDAASKEAARILEEANLSNMKSGYVFNDRQLKSPFANISNEQRQQPPFSSEYQRFQTPSSHDLYNFHLRSPVDNRSENQIQGVFSKPSNVSSSGPAIGQPVGPFLGHHTQSSIRPPAGPIQGQTSKPLLGQPAVVSMPRPPSGSSVGDFWSEFGLLPPNVELDQRSQNADSRSEKRTNDFLNDSGGGLPQAPKQPHQDENTNKETDISSSKSTEDQLNSEKSGDRKKPEKLTRRKSFTDDPVIDALVDAKVQEIMAACKEKGHPRAGIEKPKPVKSPKQSSQSTLLMYEKQQIYHGFRSEQQANNQSFPPKTVPSSVYDFNEGCDDINIQNKKSYKDLPQQVMDMRRFNKEKHEFKSSGSLNQKFPSNSAELHAEGTNWDKEFNQQVKHQEERITHHNNPVAGNAVDQIKMCFDGFNSDISRLDKPSLNKHVSEREIPNNSSNEKSKCCTDCHKSGQLFSENCHNSHKIHHMKDSRMDDPFQFSDNLSSIGPYLKRMNPKQENMLHSWSDQKLKSEHEKFLSSYEKVHAGHEVSSETKYDVQYLSDNKKSVNLNFSDKYRGFNKKGLKIEKSSQKLKTVTSKLERPQGQISATKKFGSKPYGIKSSFALLKKSQKFHNAKLPAIRKKWRNNPKYKKIPKDDFAEKLMKNLGFPPLTLKDLISKRHCKLPKGYVNGHSTIAASMLNVEDKAASRGTLPASDNGSTVLTTVAKSHSSDKSCEPSALAKMITDLNGTHSVQRSLEGGNPMLTGVKYQRSRSADQTFLDGDPEQGQRPRSLSFDSFKREPEFKVISDNSVTVDSEKVKTISEQISGLHEKITGKENNLEQNKVIEIPKCACVGTDEISSEAIDGPYYTHLGSGRSLEAIRKTLEERTGHSGISIRIEKVRYTGKEGKSVQGCPIAKWIVRRSCIEEKYLALVKHRVNHTCETAWLIIALVAWEGVPATQADDLYEYLSHTLPPYGNETERRCGTNDRKTCACQGADLMKRGASFSFGCSWSMYFNGCKFARSTHARKFRLKNEEKETELEDKLQDLANHVGPLYQQCAPDAHDNQCYYSKNADDCRLGNTVKRPFSGVTACLDFCAHAHKDIHNMNNGSTVVVSLTKHRGLSKAEDEQLHVLPMYVLEPTDEAGSYEEQYEKIRKGSLEVLHQFPREARMRAHPLQSCKKRRMNKKGRGGSKAAMNGRMSPWDSSSSAQSTPKKDYFQNQDALLSPAGSHGNTPVKQNAMKFPLPHSDKPISYDDLMAMSTQAGFNTLYDKFWDYFYAFGVFPPPSILAASLQGSMGEMDKSLSQANFKIGEKIRQQDKPKHLTSVDPVNNSSVPSYMAKSQDNQHMANPQHQMANHQDQHQMANPQDHMANPQDQRHMANHQDQHHMANPQDQHHMANHQDQHHMANPQHHLATPQDHIANPQDQRHMANPQHHMANHQGQHHMTKSQDYPHNSSVFQANPVQVENPFSDPPQYNNKPLPRYGNGISHSFNDKLATEHNSRMDIDANKCSGARDIPVHVQSGVTSSNSTNSSDPIRHSKNILSYSQPANLPSQFQPDSQALDLSFSSSSSKSDGNTASSERLVQQPGILGSSSTPDINKSLPQYSLTEPSIEKNLATTSSYQSPLDLLSQAADVHSRHVGFSGTLTYAHTSNQDKPTERVAKLQGQTDFSNKNSQQSNFQPGHSNFGPPSYNEHVNNYRNNPPGHYMKDMHDQQRSQLQQQGEIAGMNAGNQCWKPYDSNKPTSNENIETFKNEQFVNPAEPSLPDPDVVKCEIEYNTEAFVDPNIGGVAIALTHRAVLFEVAKRELHATTGLKNPNRYHPTRISLVFYQHKNLNNERHGMYAYEKKLEDMKLKRIEQMQLERGYVDMKEIEDSFKGGKKRKLTDEEVEIAELLQSSKGEYKFMLNCNTNRCDANTTDTVSTKWIDPSPIVTGPYQKWV